MTVLDYYGQWDAEELDVMGSHITSNVPDDDQDSDESKIVSIDTGVDYYDPSYFCYRDYL